MKAGITPALLVSQVKNTASWLWQDHRADAATRVLDDIDAATACYRGAEGMAYLALLLAALRAPEGDARTWGGPRGPGSGPRLIGRDLSTCPFVLPMPILGRVIWGVGMRSDYRRTFWRMAGPALRRKQIEELIHLAVVTHHLVRFTRDCLEGTGESSLYSPSVTSAPTSMPSATAV